MNTQLTLAEEMEINDDIDRLLHEEILQIVQNKQILPLVRCQRHQKLNISHADEKYLKPILPTVDAQIEVNALSMSSNCHENTYNLL